MITTQIPLGTTQFALDYGTECHLTWSNATDSIVLKFNSITEAFEAVIERCGDKTTIAAERSLGSYNIGDYNRAVELAAKNGIILLAISANQTKNYRKDNDILKSDENDARAIWSIVYATNYETGSFNLRELPHGSDMKSAIRRIRAGEYTREKRWLKVRNFPENAAYCQMLIVAYIVLNEGGGRNAFDKACGLYGLGAPSIQRASAMRDLLRVLMAQRDSYEFVDGKRVVDMGDKAKRKDALKEIRKTSRHIFSTLSEEFLMGSAYSLVDLQEVPVGVLPIN